MLLRRSRKFKELLHIAPLVEICYCIWIFIFVLSETEKDSPNPYIDDVDLTPYPQPYTYTYPRTDINERLKCTPAPDIHLQVHTCDSYVTEAIYTAFIRQKMKQKRVTREYEYAHLKRQLMDVDTTNVLHLHQGHIHTPFDTKIQTERQINT